MTRLRCRICESELAPAPLAACPRCDGPLDLVGAPRPERAPTPLVEAPRLGDLLGVELHLKLETANPTHSFKDRIAEGAVAAAAAFGLEAVCCSSGGNLGEAVLASCAARGLEPVVLAPADEARAGTYAVRGDLDACRRLEQALARRLDWGFVDGNLEAFASEGAKTVAYELEEQLGRSPDAVAAPLASGTLFAKIAQGFAELGGPLPRMVGGQPAGCPPLAAAFLEERRPSRVTPRTAARSLAVGDPHHGELALAAARLSGGAIRSVPEEKLRSYAALLAETTGVFADSAAGVALGALLRCVHDGTLAEGARVVLVVTGTPAQKPPRTAAAPIAADPDAFLSAYGG